MLLRTFGDVVTVMVRAKRREAGSIATKIALECNSTTAAAAAGVALNVNVCWWWCVRILYYQKKSVASVSPFFFPFPIWLQRVRKTRDTDRGENKYPSMIDVINSSHGAQGW